MTAKDEKIIIRLRSASGWLPISEGAAIRLLDAGHPILIKREFNKPLMAKWRTEND